MDSSPPAVPDQPGTSVTPNQSRILQTLRSTEDITTLPSSSIAPHPPSGGDPGRTERQRAASRSGQSAQEETWVDFLRNPPGANRPGISWEHSRIPQHPRTRPSGPPLALAETERAREAYIRDMVDRKRRLTASDSPERRNGNGPSQSTVAGSSRQAGMANTGHIHGGAMGSSAATAIDLTSSPPRSLPRRASRSSTERRQSDVVLPRWQPDAEVSQCPVCHNQFTFFYRKHHCRKCGRVVCAACSPHRITIPRQFIVHPPAMPSAIIDLTGELEESPSPVSPRQMWGGEEVRVCNPCVPDPNLSPPPNFQHPADPSAPLRWQLSNPGDGSGPRPPPRRHRNSTGPQPPHTLHPGHRSTLSDAALLSSAQDAFRNRQIAFNNPSSVRDLWPPTAPPSTSASNLYPPRTSSANAGGPAPPPYRYRSLLDTTTPMNAPSAPPPSRRVVAEEDECPICGNELPAKGPNGETTEREAHVQDCINAHTYGSTPPPLPRTHSAPRDAETAEDVASASTSVPTVASSSLPTSNSLGAPSSYASGASRVGQRRMTGGRMLVYRATEKDCLGEDGEVQECVICFEEFEEGDEMGRLECLCKFHRACIRSWWDTKGMGSCPTHQLHD